MTEKRQPRGPALPPFGAVTQSQNTTNHVFVDLQAKGLGQMQDNSRTTKAGVSPFEFTDGLDQFRRRPLRAGLALGVRRVEESVFELLDPAMETSQG